jgi:hypothetical protein
VAPISLEPRQSLACWLCMKLAPADGEVIVAVGVVALGVVVDGAAVCAKAGTASTVASAAAVKVRFIMDNPPLGGIFKNSTKKRRLNARP